MKMVSAAKLKGDEGRRATAIAFNTWSGAHARPAPEGAAGLRWFGVTVPTKADLDAVAARLEGINAPYTRTAEGIEVRDPSQNLVRVSVA